VQDYTSAFSDYDSCYPGCQTDTVMETDSFLPVVLLAQPAELLTVWWPDKVYGVNQ